MSKWGSHKRATNSTNISTNRILDEEGINRPEMEEDEWGNGTEIEEEERGDKEMNDCDGGDSTNPDGLEGSEAEDIFAYVDKNVGGKSNVGVETNVGNKPNASGFNEWYSDQDFEMHILYGSSDQEEMDDRFAEFNEDVDMVKPELKVEMGFKNAQVFRNVLKEWLVQ